MRVLLHTFGCKANQYDTEVVRQRLERSGCDVVTDPALADAAVVNSCTVTHEGERKLRQMVRRLARRQPALRTVVMGCAAALDDGTIAGLPSVAAVVGGADPDAVVAALGVGAPSDDERQGGELLQSFSHSRAWLKIQDGCDEHCTFCATTLARGANRSREPREIVAEARLLALRHEEIVLTGVHIGTYGQDGDGSMTLGRLAARLVAEVPAVRFRLSSVEATEVCADLERLMSEQPGRLAPHLHAPLQSGSDAVLKRMGRHWYTAASYRSRIEALAQRLPSFGLGADIITGFPGERDADHRATIALVEALPFTYLHVFPYSPRAGTAAPRLGPAVEPRSQAERSAELRQLAARKAAAHRAARAGAVADLVLEARQGGVRQALSEDYLAVQVAAETGGRRLRARLELREGRLRGVAA